MADELAPPLPAPPPLPDLVRRYLNGESIATLATECRRSRQSLYNWLHSAESDTVHGDLVRQVLISRIADADEQIEAAQTPLDLARAREMARFARWDAERRRPQLFGLKQEIKQDSSIVIEVRRGVVEPQVIEAQAVDNEAS